MLTLLRLLFVPFIAIAIIEQRFDLALAIFVIAGLSDGLDGLLARWLKQRTTLGEYLDPIADKLLLSTTFLVLSATGHLPWWITVIVFSRDVGILLVSALLYITTSLRDYRPSVFGKANTVAQIATVLLVLLDPVLQTQGIVRILRLCMWTVGILTMLSAVHYIFLVTKRLRSQPS